MTQSNYTVITLKPTEGMTLTQTDGVDIKDRVLAKELFLAINDDPSNWKEITDEEAETIRAEKALNNETLYN